MAKAVLTLEDAPDGGVTMQWDCDIDNPDGPATPALRIAWDLDKHIREHAEFAEAKGE